jgi:hypothetical protein
MPVIFMRILLKFEKRERLDMRYLMLNYVVLLALSVSLLSCAARYSEYSKWSGTGFKTMMLSENTFRIRFDGDIFTHRERVVDFALLKCADVTLEHGFTVFIVVDEKEIKQDREYKTAEKTYATATAIGNTVTGSSVKTGGQKYTLTEVQAENTIVCFEEKPEGIAAVYDAQIISRSIRKKYGLPTPRAGRQLSHQARPKPAMVRKEETNMDVPTEKPGPPTEKLATQTVWPSPPERASRSAEAMDASSSVSAELQIPDTAEISFSREAIGELPQYMDIAASSVDANLLRTVESFLHLPEGAIKRMRFGGSMAPVDHPLHDTDWFFVEWTSHEQKRSKVLRFNSDGSLLESD